MCENRFYICRTCGNVAGLIEDSGCKLECCGHEMEKLKAKNEHEICPAVSVSDGHVTVDVSELTKEGGINWVYLQTDHGGHRKCIFSGEDASVDFTLCREKPYAVYAYLDKGGLWAREI